MEDNFNTGMPETSGTDTSYSTTTDYSTGYSAYSPEPEQKQTLSIVSLVCGIVGLILGCCCCLGFIADIAAIVTGIIAKKKNVPGQGMALAGIICGAIGAVIYLGFTIYSFATGGASAFSNSFMEGFQEGLNSGAVMFF